MLGLFWLRLRQVRELLRRHGISRTLFMVKTRLKHGPGAPIKNRNVFAHYDFIRTEAVHLSAEPARSNTLLWFIPDFNIGSGGHQTIFRMVWHLERMGWESSIVIVDPTVHASAELARNDICQHFFPLNAKVFLGFQALPNSEFVVATGWQTAYPVRAISALRVKKLYFVQDFEPSFYPTGTESVLAENTYHFGFFGITAGAWLACKLKAEYGMATHAIHFGVDHELYYPRPKRDTSVKRVFFYARPPTPRRAFELGLLVLEAVSRRLPETQFILAGWDVDDYHIPFPHLATGVISPKELADVFSQCDAALVLSLTNLSLMPLELMAAGCAVVSNRGECVEWLLNDEVALLTDPTPEALTEALSRLLENDVLRQTLCHRARAFAQEQHWSACAQAFEQGLIEARELLSVTTEPIQ
ncbi:glycosyltransferase family 4 protein [Comamonas sp. SCN 65-56]|uniref:glycosyltransferase family 4 protein n=1 Tax=Comamonas sp. SCN 65-56 TaxID=1660095 RepID=UPI000AD3A542|nr:glycosyltransferase family 4 protein [Comamonas sp. SCN 65-56]